METVSISIRPGPRAAWEHQAPVFIIHSRLLYDGVEFEKQDF